MVELTSRAPLVTIIGGSGFVGRYIAQRMARRGWRVRVAVRRPNDAHFVRPYGVVGQVEPIQCNIRNDESVRRAVAGATTVVNCVGVLWQAGANTFQATQAEGAADAARIAAEEGVSRFIHISAIGADSDSPSEYGRTKAAGEAAVLDAFPGALIFRPSIIFGTEDEFFNQFAGMARISPVVPVVGANTKFQPVWVEDVADAAAKGAAGEAPAGIYELGGPRAATFRECMELMLKVIKRRRLIAGIPLFAAGIQAWFLEKTALIGVQPLLTRDQVKLLGRDNVVSGMLPGFKELDIEPTSMEAILETYLYSYRPYGQYADLTSDRADA